MSEQNIAKSGSEAELSSKFNDLRNVNRKCGAFVQKLHDANYAEVNNKNMPKFKILHAEILNELKKNHAEEKNKDNKSFEMSKPKEFSEKDKALIDQTIENIRIYLNIGQPTQTFVSPESTESPVDLFNATQPSNKPAQPSNKPAQPLTQLRILNKEMIEEASINPVKKNPART